MRHLVCAAVLALVPCSAVAQDQTIAVPPNVVVDGAPAVPQSIADALAPYAQFRWATLMAWHPKARRILVQTAFGNAPQIHVVDGPGRARTQLTYFSAGVPPIAGYDPAHPDTFVFWRDVSAGKEAYQLYRFDVPTKKVTLLTDGTSRHGAPVWSPLGSWVAFDSTRRNGKDRDLYVMQPAHPHSERLVAEVNGNWHVEDWSPDGRALLAEEDISGSESRLWRVDVKTGAKTRLTDEAARANWSSPQYSPNGKSVYALSDKGSDLTRLWRFDLASHSWTALTRSDEDVELFRISPNGKLVAIVYKRDSSSVLEVVELPSLHARRLPWIAPGVIWTLDWRPNSREIGFTYGSLATYRDAYSIDLQTGMLERWTTSEIGGFNPATLPQPEIIHWKSFDGRKISGVLYRPAARFKGPRPVMINIHGGPADEYERPRFIGRSNYFLNEDGVALIYPNVRGSAGFGKAFQRLDDGMKREDAVKDIGALLDWIVTQPELDQTRVMLTGASYGGYLTLAAAIAYNDRIRCAFEGAGITNFITFMEQTAPVRLDDRRREYGDERDPEMRDFLTRISPVTHAAAITKPIMIAQPGNDTRVPPAQAEEMVKALRAHGTPVWYILYKDEGHEGFLQHSRITNDFNQALWIEFVETYLLR
ncbi:MAG TPA: prolyl oligopeptidase family serine peptidase [Vicinamibacterales bacterium]|nr:prolyl oligopeptidase family serine peptidase [Vicinamibacterales bacterium]